MVRRLTLNIPLRASILVWRGFGWAVVGLTFVALILTELGVEKSFSDEQYYQDHGWPKLLGLALAAVLVWLLANYLEKRPARVVIARTTAQELALRDKHDLFFVPLRFWPAILVVAGFCFVIFG
jgi:hypothetical protein